MYNVVHSIDTFLLYFTCIYQLHDQNYAQELDNVLQQHYNILYYTNCK